MFRNVNLSNLENVYKKNLKTGRASECIFRASGGTDFENFLTQRQLWVPGMYQSAQKISGYVTDVPFQVT